MHLRKDSYEWSETDTVTFTWKSLFLILTQRYFFHWLLEEEWKSGRGKGGGKEGREKQIDTAVRHITGLPPAHDLTGAGD